MGKVSVLLALESEQLAGVDAVRGKVTRSAWLRAAVDAALARGEVVPAKPVATVSVGRGKRVVSVAPAVPVGVSRDMTARLVGLLRRQRYSVRGIAVALKVDDATAERAVRAVVAAGLGRWKGDLVELVEAVRGD